MDNPESVEALLARVHRFVDGGLDITTFGNAQEGTTGVEIKWFREGWRPVAGDTLEEALRDVLAQAVAADEAEAAEEAHLLDPPETAHKPLEGSGG